MTTDNNGYPKICYMCHRPEEGERKLIHIPGDIYVCNECMQKTFDSMGSLGPESMMPFMQGMPSFDPKKDSSAYNTDEEHKDSDSIAEEERKTQFEEISKEADDTMPPKEDSKKESSSGWNGTPNISLINLADIQGLSNLFGNLGYMQPQPARAKKPKPSQEKEAPVIDIENIPPPHEIRARLDEYVVGQDHAKKVMAVGVYNHYKRVFSAGNLIDDDVEIEKSNMLMVGPTGCGKTYMVRTLAKLLDVPLAITDATSLTEAGYIGDDIESVVSKLLSAADNDVERAQTGIIFIDEIDKLAKKKNAHQRDVSGESVQQGMLKLLEGAEVEVPIGASSKNAMVPMTVVDTSNILFICGGAFPDLEDIIKERLNKSSSMGFVSDLKDKYDKEKNLLSKVTSEDLRKFGMIPEFLGRMPILFALEALDEEALVRVLTEPKNAITRQYKKLLHYDEVDLVFEEGALHAIAKKAMKKELGARGLRSIIEEFMLDIMYEIPKDDNIGTVIVTEDYVNGTGGPTVLMRSVVNEQGN